MVGLALVREPPRRRPSKRFRDAFAVALEEVAHEPHCDYRVEGRGSVFVSKRFGDGLCNTAPRFDAFLTQPEDDLKNSRPWQDYF